MIAFKRLLQSSNLVPLLLASACDGYMPPGDQPAREIRPAENWQSLFGRADGWTGGDGAGTVPLPNNRTLWLFGDSWIGPVRDGKHAAGSTMVNNAIAVHAASAAPPSREQVTFHWGRPNAKAQPTAWIVPPADESARDKNLRYWPAGGGIVVADRAGHATLFVFFARIRDSGAEGIWNFEGCGSAVARIDNPADPPHEWRIQQTTLTRLPAPVPPGTRRVAWGAAALRVEDETSSTSTVLIYGVDSTDGFNKKLLLARAPAATPDRFETWSFRRGSEWSPRAHDARPIADNVMDEFSISRVPSSAGPRLVMIYTKPILDDHIVARVATHPEGPWSPAREIHRCPEPSRDKRLFAYSAKAHPELSARGELLITYCVNSNDFWHMAADASIYRPRFVRISRDDIFK